MSADVASVPPQQSLPPTVRAAFEPVSGLEDAQAYTRTLAHSHYENFSVVSFLLPKHLRQDFCNVYAFCRTADDLGDEIGNPAAALQLLAGFKAQLAACYKGKANTAVFVALRGTIDRHEIPAQPFFALIDAFEQDQRINRYDTFDQLVDYCRRSADPVGRLVLYMCGYRDDQRQRLSDKTCTALQLANFWQDVRRDITERNRIYIPRDSMSRFNVTEEQITSFSSDENFRRLMQFEVDRTQAMFDEGRNLLPLLEPVYRRQIGLFGAGGEAILRAIRRRGFDTLSGRPRLSPLQKGRLIARALVAALLQKFSRQGGSR